MKKLNYLTTGQFAKLHKINKRTLHYYDEIDLLKPVEVGENGYRYYTNLQSIDLEVILILRKLGLSIDEIKQYKKDRGSKNLERLFTEQIDLINKKIKTLNHTKKFLNIKLEQLKKAESIKDGQIDIIDVPEEKILVSEVFRDDSDEDYFRLMAEFSAQLKAEQDIYNNFGARIDSKMVYENKLLTYDRFFVRSDETCKNIKSEIKPKGKYVRAYCKGDWHRIMDMYRELLKYAEENSFEYEGYCYEEGINEMASKSFNDIFTKITIKIKDK